ncbi:MAG TPA: MFS transporter, partial [Anaeromyxobacter sp.]|nr:MFS transporter [Anaeromyxobacter sp.]
MSHRETDVAPRSLVSFEFVGLCVVAFLAVCNVTVFYNLFGYLASLGVPAQVRGLLVGAASLTAMVLYLVASPFVGVRRAPAAMLVGMAVLAASGWAYLAVHGPFGILVLRVLNGAGHFLLGAGATALLVTVMPPEKSGQAFGIYSVAILVAYGVVPAVMDALVPHLPGPAHGYALATASVLPAAWIVLRVRRLPALAHDAARDAPLRWAEIRENLTAPRVALLLALNTGYFANWSSLFFLFKGFAVDKGVGNVGTFFTVLTAVMIVIRLAAGRLFDRVRKVRLVVASFLAIAVAHLALLAAPAALIPLVGALFGLGLGAGYPAINGLMFDSSPPRLRPLNANLMLFAVQGGSFLGPAIGGAIVAQRGHPGYAVASVALALAAAGTSALLARGGPA